VELEGKSTVVVGMARSGVAAAEFLLGRGARVVATDRKPAAELPPEVTALKKKGAKLALGAHDAATFTGAELVVVSPGVPWDLPELVAARRAGVEVMAELELGFRCLEGTVAAITGTKGKSTTTAALGAMLKQGGKDVRVGGNIGEAVTGLVEGSTADTIFVLEVSSFQLEGTQAFHPQVAVFLNLSPDHLDRHASLEEYAQAKARIFRNQTADDWAVVNADDPGVLALAQEGRAQLLPFHPRPDAPLPEDRRGSAAFFAEDEARLRRRGAVETLFPLSSVRLPGAHLAGDLLAAAAAARLLGATPEAVDSAVRGFRGVEHVLERVAEIGGVAFFNDSKATNVESARKSIEAFSGPLLVVMGGRYKGGDFHELAGPLSTRGKAVLAIGEAKDRIVAALGSSLPVIPCASLAEAVDKAWAEAERGDTILLAPACSSFDMFEDYAARGGAFKDEVRRLELRELDASTQDGDG
jgi:UDP-N-acetylmuramoylalanine--D-glutamate ligase